jgi:acyl-CoA thioester hydrolase
MYSHDTQIRVRYGETDPMGYLYYGNYPIYYEVGRAEAIRALGLVYKEFEDVHHIMMPVMSMTMRYVRPALYDDVLTVRATLRHLPTDTVTFYMEIYNEKKKLVNGGSVKLCFVDMDTKRTVGTPEFILEKLRPFFSC